MTASLLSREMLKFEVRLLAGDAVAGPEYGATVTLTGRTRRSYTSLLPSLSKELGNRYQPLVPTQTNRGWPEAEDGKIVKLETLSFGGRHRDTRSAKMEISSLPAVAASRNGAGGDLVHGSLVDPWGSFPALSGARWLVEVEMGDMLAGN